MRSHRILVASLALASVAASAAPSPASDAGAAWKEECGSCHVAYPPRLLSAQGWQRLMQGLERHFGTNAQLDAQTTASISAWLQSRAARNEGRYDAASLRISETPWFVRKHREVNAASWRDPQIKSAANCGACHRGAERGNFEEDEVTIPDSRRNR